MTKWLLILFFFVTASTQAQVSTPKKLVSKPSKVKQLSLQDQLMMHWRPLKGDAVLNALAKVSVGRWVPAPRGIYPLQFINEEIEKFAKQHGKVSNQTQMKALEKKLQPHLARTGELPIKNVGKWLKTCRYEAIAEEFLPTEVRSSAVYQKLNLKGAYLFEDEMQNFINVLALKDNKVWLRTYAQLDEEQTTQTAAKNAQQEKEKTFTATMPLVDFSYVLRKTFDAKQCIGAKNAK